MRCWVPIAIWMMGTCVGPAEVPGTTGDLLPEQPTSISIGSPSIQIGLDGARVKIVFTGTLQLADAVSGPWNDIPNAASPFRQDPANRERFYRTRAPDSIFSSHSVVAFTLTGPFQSHFDLAFAGMPDGFIPPLREKPYFDGLLKMTGYEIPVALCVRGSSSLQECPFPKLKFKVAKEQRAGTPFLDALASVTR